MFANLKNKIFEEVKASPQKFQQFAQAAQAAVSSASSNASDSQSVSGSDNFFSITEEDTPQNSPHRVPAKTVSPSSSSASKQSAPVVSFANNGISINRTRRLSNSSMASDVSFRLPTYESPAIYHLQSDLDISASEVEDGAASSNVQLDVISKEQLYSAYKKSLERYQKYRSRFTELAKRYRDLERDSAKARSVLVETQDKAIRRISELREQCSLEQQAKAHLEEALRLEMDDLQCKIKTYETKLELHGENPESVIRSTEFKPKVEAEDSLIQLDSEDDAAETKAENHTNNKITSHLGDPNIELLNEKINRLEELVAKYKKQLAESSVKLKEVSKESSDSQIKLHEAETLISNLKKREEENTILLAENKLIVHTELENKESEVKRLKEKIKELEKHAGQDQVIAELKSQIHDKDKTLESVKKLQAEREQKLVQAEKESKELKLVNARKVELEKELENIAKQLTELQVLLEAKKDMEEKVKRENEDFKLQITGLKKELNDAKAQTKASQNDINVLKAEIESHRIVAKSQESEAITTLRGTLDEASAKITTLESKLQQKESDCKELEQKVLELSGDLTKANEAVAVQTSTDSSLEAECELLRKEIEKIKCESTEREIQMEKEKVELQSQVTNILQEIGRMEEQMKEVRKSHDELDEEKRMLEKKIEKMTMQNIASQEGQKKWESLIHEAEENTKLLEGKLKTVETENSQLAEKNCLQEENLKRFQLQSKEVEAALKKERSTSKEMESNYNTVRMELEATNETIKKLTEKMSQVLDENSRLHNSKEIMEHEFRSLQDQCESREKEKLCVLDNNKCQEEEIQRLRRLNDELQSTSSEGNAKLQSLVDEIESLKQSRTKLEREIQTYKDQITALKPTEEQVARLTAENINFSSIVQDLQKECAALKTEIEEATIRSEKTSSDFANQVNELHRINAELRIEKDSFSKNLNASKEGHQDQIKELENMLKQSNEELETLHKTVKTSSDLEKRLENYEEQKIENQYLNTMIHQLENEISQLKEEKLSSATEIEELRTSLESKQNNFDGDMNSIQEKLTSANEDLQKLQQVLGNEREELHREREKNNAGVNEIESLRNDLSGWKEKCLKIDAKNVEFEELRTENSRLKAESDEGIRRFKDEWRKLSEENDKHKATVKKLTDELLAIHEQVSKLETLKTENENLQAKMKELQIEISERVSKKSETVVESAKQQQSEMETLRKINETLQRELEDLKHKTSAEIMNLTHEMDDLTSNARLMTEKLTEYETLKQSLKSSQSDNSRFSDANANETSDDDNDDDESIRRDKAELESKLEKIMHEVHDVSNRNLFLEQKCENYLVLEQSNERLKLANEKLSRQLDETLVSLQHNETISANTEFEYLRNIMFQYLTGSVTGNNSTLVKVIAAVLKFTPQQTQVAIEKEHQRHTLAGQISNLL